MKGYILTGTPGCGKTSIIQALETQGHLVIHESATDVIAHEQKSGEATPWLKPNFIDKIINLQKQRSIELYPQSSTAVGVFYDRSPICTYALALYLGFEPSHTLINEIERIQKKHIYENRVFFIENLGFITHTDARKISFEESLKFEKIHVDAYAKFGYECLRIEAAPIDQRVKLLLRLL